MVSEMALETERVSLLESEMAVTTVIPMGLDSVVKKRWQVLEVLVMPDPCQESRWTLRLVMGSWHCWM